MKSGIIFYLFYDVLQINLHAIIKMLQTFALNTFEKHTFVLPGFALITFEVDTLYPSSFSHVTFEIDTFCLTIFCPTNFCAKQF